MLDNWRRIRYPAPMCRALTIAILVLLVDAYCGGLYSPKPPDDTIYEERQLQPEDCRNV